MLGGPVCGLDFVFKSPGVNRPLKPSDDPDKNLNRTFYPDQINKTENAVKDILSCLNPEPEKQVSQLGHPVIVYLQKEVPILKNLLEYYRKPSGTTKKKILGCIFAEKLVLDKGKVITPVFTEPIHLILRISEELEGFEKKNDVVLSQSLVATLTKKPNFKVQKLQP